MEKEEGCVVSLSVAQDSRGERNVDEEIEIEIDLCDEIEGVLLEVWKTMRRLAKPYWEACFFVVLDNDKRNLEMDIGL